MKLSLASMSILLVGCMLTMGCTKKLSGQPLNYLGCYDISEINDISTESNIQGLKFRWVRNPSIPYFLATLKISIPIQDSSIFCSWFDETSTQFKPWDRIQESYMK